MSRRNPDRGGGWCSCLSKSFGGEYGTLLEDCTAVADFGYAQDQNSQHQPRQEDAVTTIDGFAEDGKQAFFAVFDGDGGDDCSKFASERMHGFLMDELEGLDEDQLRPEEVSAAVKEKISKAFIRTDSSMDAEGLGQLPNSGCTAVACLIREEAGGKRYLYTGNVGDCRAVLSHSGKAFRLSHDHRAADPDEALRIEAAGGVVFDKCVMGVLTVSRALGHSPLKALVTGSPSVSRTHIKKPADGLLVIACAGVWDVMEDQEAVDFVSARLEEGQGPEGAARALIAESIKRYSTDNISVVVVKL